MQSSKAPDNTVSRLKAANFFLLPPSRGKVGMGVRCQASSLGLGGLGTAPPPAPSPFVIARRHRGKYFVTVVTVEPR